MKRIIFILTLLSSISVNAQIGRFPVFATPERNPLLYGLRAYWKIDETSGTVVDDAIDLVNGTSSSATNINASGKINYCQLFTAAESDIITFNSTVGEPGTGDFSISCWVKTVSIASTKTIAHIWTETPASSLWWQLRQTPYADAYGGADQQGYRVHTDFDNTGDDIYAEYFPINVDTWYHVVVVFDRDGNLTLYVNGDTNAESIVDISGYSAANMVNGANFILGDAPCYIDEVGIWERVLTADEITDLYNVGSGWQFPFNP